MVSSMCGLDKRLADGLAAMLAGRPGIPELASMSWAYPNPEIDPDIGRFPESPAAPEVIHPRRMKGLPEWARPLT